MKQEREKSSGPEALVGGLDPLPCPAGNYNLYIKYIYASPRHLHHIDVFEKPSKPNTYTSIKGGIDTNIIIAVSVVVPAFAALFACDGSLGIRDGKGSGR